MKTNTLTLLLAANATADRLRWALDLDEAPEAVLVAYATAAAKAGARYLQAAEAAQARAW